MIRPVLTGVLIVALQVPALAGGGLFRRSVCSSNHCAPIVHHQKAVAIVQDYVQPQQLQVVQINNNYPPAAQLGSTLYGYGEPLAYNPFQVNPGEILREAARLTETSQKLTQEGLAVYQQLGTDAIEYAAISDQLRARAELINATKPERIERQQAQQQPLGVNQTITLVPDGHGGYTIKLGQHDGAGEPTQQAGGLAVLQNRCASCHTGSASKGGFVLFDDSGELQSLSTFDKQKILSLAASGAMPPATNAAGESLPTLTDQELAQLQVYFGGN